MPDAAQVALLIQTLSDAARLSAWGIGILLIYVASQRMANLAHVAASERGWLRAPRFVYPPVNHGSDLRSSITALAAGATALAGYTTPLLGHLTHWSTLIAPPAQYLLAVGLFIVVQTMILLRIAPHPRWKLAWVGCWCTASLLIMAVAGHGAG